MRRRATAAPAVGLVLTVLGLVACGGAGSSSSSQRSTAAPVSVEIRTETFVDTSRGTAARPEQVATPSRTLETTIHLPGASAARPHAGRPLIVFAHGSGGNPDFYRVLLEAWAARGYVVAAPRFPPDRMDHPGDVSFVISELLRLSSAPTGPYAGLVDPERIGVAGHSAGGVTVLGVAFNSCCIDRRIRAGAVLAADAPPFPGGAYFTGVRTPLLVVHGLADPTVPFAEGRRIFTEAGPPKMMLTVPASDTPSADHARPFVGTENRPLHDTRLVTAATIAFFDRYVRGDGNAVDRIRDEIDAEVSFEMEIVER